MPFVVVVAWLVPWSMTNIPFSISVQIRDPDRYVIDEIATRDSVEQGRPPGLRVGSDQRLVLALPVRTEKLKAGQYDVAALVNGEVDAVTTLEIIRRSS